MSLISPLSFSMISPLSFLLFPLLMCHADVSGICEHKRIKSQCRDCAGPGICEHKRRRSRCKDCGGSGICEHGQQKNRCKECQGPGICPHGRRRIQCKDCGLSPPTLSLSYLYSCSGCVREVVNFHIHTLSLHMHSNYTHHCLPNSSFTGGSAMCPHKRRRIRCKDCGGSAICKHDKQKSRCKECGGKFT